MSEKEVGYSVYVSHIQNSLQTWSLFSGFIFTTITLLLTLFPDPSQIQVQVTLFFLAVLFDLLLYAIVAYQRTLDYSVRIAPPLPMRVRKGYPRWIEILIYGLLGVTTVLMFLIWNLLYLSLASGIVYLLFMIFGYITVYQPFIRTRQKFEAETGRTWRIRKFFDERDSIFRTED